MNLNQSINMEDALWGKLVKINVLPALGIAISLQTVQSLVAIVVGIVSVTCTILVTRHTLKGKKTHFHVGKKES